MKRFIYPFLAAALALTACQKEKMLKATGDSDGSGSIVRAPSSAGPAGFVNNFNSQDSLTAIGLMNSNSLSTDGFAFYMYQSYNALDQSNQMGFFQIAEARQIRNGLPVFFNDITYGFDNGKLNGPPPDPQYLAGNISLDNQPNLSLNAVRDIFVKTDNANEAQSISIADSLLVAQLGYYNINIDQPPSAGGTKYVKAWYVHTKTRGWPQAYIRDDNSVVLQFTPLTRNPPYTP